MNEFAMDLSAERVDDGNLEILIGSQALSVKMLGEDSAMRDRVGIGL